MGTRNRALAGASNRTIHCMGGIGEGDRKRGTESHQVGLHAGRSNTQESGLREGLQNEARREAGLPVGEEGVQETRILGHGNVAKRSLTQSREPSVHPRPSNAGQEVTPNRLKTTTRRSRSG